MRWRSPGIRVRRPVVMLTAALAAVTARADVYVSGFNSGGVYRFDESSGAPVGTGVFIAPGSGGLQLPHGVMRLDDGSFLVASAGTDEVLRYSATGGFLSKFIANGQNGVPSGTLDYPVDFARGADGELLVSSQLNDRVLRFDAVSGAYLGVFGAAGDVDGPSGLARDPVGGAVFGVGRFGNHVRKFAADGSRDLGFSPGAFTQPFGAALDADGSRLFVADGNANAVRVVDAQTGAALATFTGGLSLPVGVRMAPDGSVGVASYNGDRVVRFHAATGALGTDLITAAAAAGAGLDGPNFFAFIPPPSALELWRQTHFGTLAGIGAAANAADPDRDGLANLIEYATGSDPNIPGATPFATTLAEGRLTLSVARAPVSGVFWSAESSDDLSSWSAAGLEILTDTASRFEVRDAIPAGIGSRRFLRMRVQTP